MRKFFTSLLVLLTFGFATIPATVVVADTTDPAVSNVCSAIDCSNSQGPSVNSLLKLVLNILSVIIGFVAIVMIIINGFRFVTSSGDSSKVASARSGILYALIGLAIAALAQVLIHVVLTQVKYANGAKSGPNATFCSQHPKTNGC